MTKPRIWVHKKTKQKLMALPWWEVLEPVISDKEVGTKVSDGRAFKMGALVQIGWLLENGHGVWFGVNFKAAKSFKDVGEWEAKKRRPPP